MKNLTGLTLILFSTAAFAQTNAAVAVSRTGSNHASGTIVQLCLTSIKALT